VSLGTDGGKPSAVETSLFVRALVCMAEWLTYMHVNRQVHVSVDFGLGCNRKPTLTEEDFYRTA
jgi:hypothetical protein